MGEMRSGIERILHLSGVASSEPVHPGVGLVAPDGSRKLLRDAAAQQHPSTGARPASDFTARGVICSVPAALL